MEIKSMDPNQLFEVFFDSTNNKNKRVQMGIITLQPGEKSPQDGFARHDQDEYSFVISGEAHTVLADGRDLIGKAGDAQLIEAGEAHKNYNDGDVPATVVWFLAER